MNAGKPPSPPRRPGPPPRAPAGSSPVAAAPQSNPFQEAPTAPASNPFLAGAPAPESAPFAAPVAAQPAQQPVASQPVASQPVASQPVASQPVASQPAPQASAARPGPKMGAPLRAQPGVVAPHFKDAHAEFRKGGWQRPALFAAVAGAVLAGLFFAMPQAEQQEELDPVALTESVNSGVIGRSLPPGRIVEEEKTKAEHRQAFQQAEAEARQQQNGEAEPAERPADIPEEGEFASAFKSAAR